MDDQKRISNTFLFFKITRSINVKEMSINTMPVMILAINKLIYMLPGTKYKTCGRANAINTYNKTTTNKEKILLNLNDLIFSIFMHRTIN